jgi:hypothetical protein
VHDFDKRGTYGIGAQYINYGTIPETDESGNILKANVPSNEVNLYGGGSYRFGKMFSVGANLKDHSGPGMVHITPLAWRETRSLRE